MPTMKVPIELRIYCPLIRWVHVVQNISTKCKGFYENVHMFSIILNGRILRMLEDPFSDTSLQYHSSLA